MENLSNDLIKEEKVHIKTGLTKTVHGIYKILDAFQEHKKRDVKSNQAAEKVAKFEFTLKKLQKIAIDIDTLYTSKETAPKGWHLKEQMRKDLRATVRKIVHHQNIANWKEIPARVEEFALKHYVV